MHLPQSHTKGMSMRDLYIIIPGHSMHVPQNIKHLMSSTVPDRRCGRLYRDALYNLHKIAYDAPHFMWNELMRGLKPLLF